MRVKSNQLITLSVVVFALAGLTGCPAMSDLPAPGSLSVQRDPVMGRPYHLYVPTRYQDDRRWPLVVTCHGTNPFDNAQLQIDEWKGLAEQKGFLVAAPELVGTNAVAPETDKQIQHQLEDENAILSIVRSVRAARSINETQIFLTGWSAGGYAVLFTGLRHPDIFRALAVRQGNFKAEYVEPCIPFIDRFQPIMIMYGNIDPLQDDATACLEWLRSNEMLPDAQSRPGAHRRDPVPVYNYFADIVRHRPWIRIHVKDDPANNMHVKFSVKASFEPTRYLWDFGDQTRSPVATPDHIYERPGLYTVRIALYTNSDKPYVRQIQLQVPRIHLGVTQTAPVQ